MSSDYSIGSLVTALLDLHHNRPLREEINYRQYIKSAAWKTKAQPAESVAAQFASEIDAAQL